MTDHGTTVTIKPVSETTEVEETPGDDEAPLPARPWFGADRSPWKKGGAKVGMK